MSIVFTDVDDVLVLKRTVDFDKHAPRWSKDICRRLLHPPAMQVLTSLTENGARIVITSNWVRFLDRAGFQHLFQGGGYAGIGRALHVAWQAPPVPTGSRLDAINAWLAHHHIGEPLRFLMTPRRAPVYEVPNMTWMVVSSCANLVWA